MSCKAAPPNSRDRSPKIVESGELRSVNQLAAATI